MIYKYKATRYLVPAQQAGEYLEELRRENGTLNKFILLDSSRDKDALLHGCFEWNDSKAAEAYRLDQAQHFISNIVCVMAESEEKEPMQFRAFVNVADQAHSEKGSFVPIVEALSQEGYRQIVLKNALSELKTFKEKYSQFKELAKVFTAIDEVTNVT